MLVLLTNPTTWFVIGALLLIIEMFEGSLAFFLPIGIASLVISGLVAFWEINISTILVLFAVFSLVFATTLRFYSKSIKKKKTKDINKY